MTEEQAEQSVQELLDKIDKHKLRDIHIPHARRRSEDGEQPVRLRVALG